MYIINLNIYHLLEQLLQADENGIDVELEAEPEVNFLEEVLLISEPVFTDKKIHIQLREETKNKLAKILSAQNAKIVKKQQVLVDFIIHLIDYYGLMEDYEVCDRITHFLGIEIELVDLLTLIHQQIDLKFHTHLTEFDNTFYIVNALIPSCGSGKKYKNCCLNKVISVDFRHEASKDCISEEDAKLFFDLKNSLFDYINKKYHINPDLKDIRDICDAEPEEVIEIRTKIWEDKKVIQNYIKENPHHLSSEHLSILKEWNEKKINNKFILYKYEEEFAIFMDDKQVYAVKGLKERIIHLIPQAKLPLFVETVLLPLHGQIVYDSYLLQYTLSFGKGMKDMLDKTYQKALKDNSIIYKL